MTYVRENKAMLTPLMKRFDDDVTYLSSTRIKAVNDANYGNSFERRAV